MENTLALEKQALHLFSMSFSCSFFKTPLKLSEKKIEGVSGYLRCFGKMIDVCTFAEIFIPYVECV